MADTSLIEWTEATWNPITGCGIESAGCTNCYAMKLAGTRLANHPSRAGLTRDTKVGPVWTGEVRFNEQWLDQPIRWKRPRMIFVCAHADLFHDSVPDEWIDRIFAITALCPQHTFQVLTKRSARMRDYLSARKGARGLMVPIGDGTLGLHPFNAELKAPRNVWVGVSVEDRAHKARLDDLRETPAALRWVSAEPLLESLGAVDLNGIDWVVVGGESGPGARPMHPDWARSLRDQCLAARVPFFFKQWGEWAPIDALRLNGAAWAGDRPISRRGNVPDWMDRYVTFQEDAGAIRVRGHSFTGHATNLVYRVGKRAAGRLLDGRNWSEYPQ